MGNLVPGFVHRKQVRILIEHVDGTFLGNDDAIPRARPVRHVDRDGLALVDDGRGIALATLKEKAAWGGLRAANKGPGDPQLFVQDAPEGRRVMGCVYDTAHIPQKLVDLFEHRGTGTAQRAFEVRRQLLGLGLEHVAAQVAPEVVHLP